VQPSSPFSLSHRREEKRIGEERDEEEKE